MSRFAQLSLLGLAILLAGNCAAQVVDMSGTWNLNVEKSKWGKVPKPVSVVVTVTHKEPNLSYKGRIVQMEGEETREFSYSGIIDGQEHPQSRSTFGDGKIILKRVDDTTVTSEFKSNDGNFEESVRTVITRDGKLMRRMMERKGTSGDMAWMEVYEKQ